MKEERKTAKGDAPEEAPEKKAGFWRRLFRRKPKKPEASAKDKDADPRRDMRAAPAVGGDSHRSSRAAREEEEEAAKKKKGFWSRLFLRRKAKESEAPEKGKAGDVPRRDMKAAPAVKGDSPRSSRAAREEEEEASKKKKGFWSRLFRRKRDAEKGDASGHSGVRHREGKEVPVSSSRPSRTDRDRQDDQAAGKKKGLWARLFFRRQGKPEKDETPAHEAGPGAPRRDAKSGGALLDAHPKTAAPGQKSGEAESPPKKVGFFSRLFGFLKRKKKKSAADQTAAEMFSWDSGGEKARPAGGPRRKELPSKKPSSQGPREAAPAEGEAGEKAEAPAPHRRSWRKLAFIFLLLAAIGGGAAFFMNGDTKQGAPAEAATEAQQEDKGGAAEENAKESDQPAKETGVASNSKKTGTTSTDAGKDIQPGDCSITDKASVAEKLKKCIEEFNASAGG